MATEKEGLEPRNEEIADPEVLAEIKRELIAEKHFRGPLPPPELLKGYNEIHPDFADRIFSSWEKETTHRHALEEATVTAEIEAGKAISGDVVRGQILAFILCLAFLVAGCFLTYHDKQISGVIFGSTGFIGIVLAFLKTAFKSRDRKNGSFEEDQKE